MQWDTERNKMWKSKQKEDAKELKALREANEQWAASYEAAHNALVAMYAILTEYFE